MEDEPTVEPDDGEEADETSHELGEELKKPAEREEHEPTPEEREKLRLAMARIHGALNPQVISALADITRSGALAKFAADVPTMTLAQLMPSITGAATWTKQMQVINSDLYKVRGVGQSTLTDFSSMLAKNADFGFNLNAVKLAAQFATQQTSWLKTSGFIRESLKRSFYPLNLRGIENLEFEEVEEVVMLDGIALYGVPRAGIAEKLIRAQSSAARRDILGHRWKAISADCKTAVESCTSGAVAPYVSFASAALDALDAGNPKAAQALAASVLDTVVNGYFGKQRYGLTPNKKTTTTAEYDKYSLREFIALAPLWQAYQKFKMEDGDPIPTTFSRHATVHGVSERQFSRRNAVQAVLFVTSLLLFVDEEGSALEAA